MIWNQSILIYFPKQWKDCNEEQTSSGSTRLRTLVLTYGDPSQNKQRDAGGNPQEAVAEAAEQQTREQSVAPSHHITPAALTAAHTKHKTQILFSFQYMT